MAKPPRLDPSELRWRIGACSEESVTLESLEVPATFEARLEHPAWPAPVHLYVTVDAEAGPIATGLRSLGGQVAYPHLHDTIARTIDLSRLLRELTADATGVRAMVRARDQLDVPLGDLEKGQIETLGQIARLTSDRAYAVTRPRRRRVATSDHLRQVAEVYRAALSDGEPPTLAVAERFSTSHSNAARWVRQAREAGHLGAAIGPRAGEAREK
jgi:hypothetical protein